MALYVYQAKALGGKVVRGEIEAENDTEVRMQLRAQRLIPVKVQEKGAKKAKARGARGKVSSKHLQVMTRQFATLINSGIPIVQSLEILSGNADSPPLQNALIEIKGQIETGRRLGEAMNKYPKVFDRLYVNLVTAGEEGGVLDTILNRLAMYIEKSVKIQAKVKGAMMYPAGIILVALIVISAILVFIIPKFEEMFKSMGNELPALTQFVVDLSHFFVNYWYAIFGTLFGLFQAFKWYISTPKGKRVWHLILISSPIIGDVIQKGAVARFSRTLSTMLASGVSVIQGLEIAGSTVGNILMEETLIECRNMVEKGKSMVVALQKDKWFPDMVVQMVGVGEQTGAMDVMLEKVADFYEDEVDAAVGAMTAMMEPLLMIFLGGTIAFLVIAMYLPIFSLAGNFG